MSLSAKRESLARIHGRYQRAGRPHQRRILEEFCATCGYHRKSALRLLNRPLRKAPFKRPGPKIIYEPAEVLPVLAYVLLRFCAYLGQWPHSFTRLFALIRSALWQRHELTSLLEVYGTAGGGGRFLGTPQQAYLAGFG